MEHTDINNRNREEILKFCPVCGQKIEWAEDLRYCIHCGTYLVRHINKDKISDWLGVTSPLSEQEIDQLYSPANYPSQFYQGLPSPGSKKRRTSKWGWKPALGVPLLATLVKFLVLILPAILIFFLYIDDIDLDNLIIPGEIVLWLTLLELVLQTVFIFITIFAVKYYLPEDASIKDRFRAVGIPIEKLDKKGYIKEILIGIGIAIVMTITVILVQYASAYITGFIYGISPDELMSSDSGALTNIFPKTTGFLIILIFLMFISIGPSEEILFRGFTQKGFENSLGKAGGLIVTAFYFSIFHIYVYILDPPSFLFLLLPYLAISLILGSLYSWRKNLIAPIIAHALYNSIQFMILFLL